MRSRTSRRRFLVGTVAGGAGLLILRSSRSAGSYRANEKLNVALVGVGGRGRWFVHTTVLSSDGARSLPVLGVFVYRGGY